MSEHERIWLEPAPGADEDYGRQWCQDNVWDDGVEYVLADAVSAITAERDRLREALEKISGFTSRCEHDGGLDRETGPIGCMLGDKCVCIGIHPVARDALGGSYAD
jgi:hypothetical protein